MKIEEESMGAGSWRKSILYIVLIFMIVALIPLQVFSQDLPLLTLDECIQKGLKNDPSLVNSETSLKRASNNMWTSYASFLPSVNVSSNYNWSSDFSFYDQDYYRSSLSVYQNGFRGFTELFDLQSSKKSKMAAEKNFDTQVMSAIYNIKTGYYNVLKTMKLADVQKKALERSNEQLRITETRYELGSAALSDVLKAKVSNGEAKLNLISAENSYKISMAQLNYIIGENVTRQFKVDPSVSATNENYTLNGSMDYAMEYNPNLKALKYSMDASKSSVRSAWTGFLPYLNMNWSASWYNPDGFAFGNTFSKNRSTSYSIGVGFNIFDRFMTKRTVSDAKAQYNNDKFSYFNRLNGLKLEVTESYLNFEKSQLSMEVASDKLASATEDYKLAQEKYSLGAATILDLLDAEVSLKSAESDVIESEYNLNLAVANLEKAMGINQR
jgi:outer membrane protein